MKILDLLEVNMSPSALKDFMSSSFAQELTIGFEFELIVPGLEDFGGHNSGEDLTKDEPFPITPDWKKKAYEWLIGGRDHSTTIWINKQLNNLETTFINWKISTIYDYIMSPRGVSKVKQEISKLSNTKDPTKILAHYNAVDNVYNDAVKKVKEEFNTSPNIFKKFLRIMKITNMGDFCNNAALKYPYQYKYKHTMLVKDLTKDFAKYTTFKVDYSKIYHDLTREPNLWIFEPDNSVLDPTRNGAGIELVSPPMKFQPGLAALDKVWDWTKQATITTNETTGMHVGISIPGHELTKIDYVKLILFLGDNHILKTFNRVDNEYALSMLEHMKTQTRYNYDINHLLHTIKKGINKLAKNAAFQHMTKSDEKYVTVNIKGNYIEFRAAGGDYLSQKNLIMNTIARYIKALSIASDTKSEKDEYAKKLYKMISGNMVGQHDPINTFVKYAAGQLTKNQVKSILKNLRRASWARKTNESE
jgi:hypothetical protein